MIEVVASEDQMSKVGIALQCIAKTIGTLIRQRAPYQGENRKRRIPFEVFRNEFDSIHLKSISR